MIVTRTRSKLTCLILAGAVFASGCLHSTRLVTEPEGANVTVNGQFLGPSPVIYQDRGGVPKTYYIKIEKPGYKTIETGVDSVYKADIHLLALLAAIFGYFFTAELEDNYKFILQQ